MNVTRAEIEEVARQTNAHNFIMQLPDVHQHPIIIHPLLKFEFVAYLSQCTLAQPASMPHNLFCVPPTRFQSLTNQRTERSLWHFLIDSSSDKYASHWCFTCCTYLSNICVFMEYQIEV